MSEAHICPHSVDGTRCPEIVFVMRRILSSAVCGRHVSLWCPPPPPHTTTLSNSATKKLVNTKNKVSESGSVKMRVAEMLSLGFDDFLSTAECGLTQISAGFPRLRVCGGSH